ncbi:TSUP family transporter [Geoglobus ahangari]|nr:TSUP family transporter [Geoglobus ahangari]
MEGGMDTYALVLLFPLVFLAFNVRVVTGFGSAILLSPLLSNLLPPKDVVVLMILLESLINLNFLLRERLTLRLGEVYAGGFAGIMAGMALFGALSQRLIGLGIGAGMAALSALMMRGVRFEVRRERPLLFFSGLISGLMGVLTGVNGPQIVLALSNQGYDAKFIRSFIIAYLIIIDTLILLLFIALGYMSWEIVRIFAILSPAVFLAHLTGRRLLGRMDSHSLRKAVLSVVLASSLVLVVRYSGVWA